MRIFFSLLFTLFVAVQWTNARAEAPFFIKTTTGPSVWGIDAASGLVAAVGPGGVARTGFGDVWHTQILTGKPLLLAVKVIDDQSSGPPIIAVGGRNGFTDGTATIVISNDNGASFKPISGLRGGTLYDIFFLDRKTGFASGIAGTLLKTTDGGQSWASLDTGTAERIWASQFLTGDTGLIGGGETPWQNDGKSTGFIRRTSDGGATWKTVLATGKRISDFAFIDERTGYAGGVGGVLWKTPDAGKSWMKVGPTPLKTIINAIEFVSETCGLIVGAGGTAYVTTDGGKTWPHKVTVTKGSFLEDLAPADQPGSFWVAAGDGTVGLISLGKACTR